MNKYLSQALISLSACVCVCPIAHGVETVPVNVTEEMLFADDPKVWLSISRVSTPVYPKDQFAAGVTGYVDLDVTVDEIGAVKKIGDVTSKPVNAAFEQAARESVKYWKFKSKLTKQHLLEWVLAAQA